MAPNFDELREFFPQDEVETMAKNMEGSMLNAYRSGGTKAMRDLGIKGSFKTVDKAALAFFRDYSLVLSTKETATIIDNMKAIIFSGLKEGKDIDVIARELRITGLSPYTKKMPTTPKEIRKIVRYRARMISRTETLRASNMGRMYSYKAHGVKRVRWIVGPHPCPECADLEGVESPIDEALVPPAHPNCYDGETEVLTERGWKYFSKLNGERIWSLNPKTSQMELVHYKNIISYSFDGKLMRIYNRWFDLLVTPDHRMAYVSDWDSKQKGIPIIKIKEAKNINKWDCIPRTGRWIGESTEKIKIGKHSFNSKDFMAFMGWYLSEGSVSKVTRGQLQITIAQQDVAKRKEIKILLKRMFSKFGEGKKAFYIRSDDFGEYLQKLGHSFNKFIPSELKELDSNLLRVFLDAFNKGDGSTRKSHNKKYIGNFRNEITYATSSPMLASDLGEVILKTGNYPSYYLLKVAGKEVIFKNGRYKINNDVWVIRECRSRYVRNKRKVEEMDYKGLVYDVELEKNHILFVRRNGKCCWSGNCKCVNVAVIEK